MRTSDDSEEDETDDEQDYEEEDDEDLIQFSDSEVPSVQHHNLSLTYCSLPASSTYRLSLKRVVSAETLPAESTFGKYTLLPCALSTVFQYLRCTIPMVMTNSVVIQSD